jgi:hypothetical protein
MGKNKRMGNLDIISTGHNKNYMSIAVSVLIAEFSARHNPVAARQKSSPKSATAYSSERYRAF